MNDREFIELLNLYVDKEINPEDALRLEVEVGADPERRKVYDQYCRIQRACGMLSEQLADSAAERTVVFDADFRASRAFPLAPVMAGLAAAACITVLFGLRERGTVSPSGTPTVAVESAGPRPAPEAVERSRSAEPMTPVFITRPVTGQADRSAARPIFAMDAPSQMPQLNWIEEIQMEPVRAAADSDFLLNRKPELKAPISSGVQGSRDSQQPAEMTAFRFQR